MNKLKILAFAAFVLHGFDVVAEEAGKPIDVVVYRSESCGCCGKWIEHLKQNRFNVKTVFSDDMQTLKEKYGIPDKLASCHTAVVNGYVVEGHVPAGDIEKMLKQKPDILGIAAPGMPMGSPGMEMDGQTQDYKVISYDKDGKLDVFASHVKNK